MKKLLFSLAIATLGSAALQAAPGVLAGWNFESLPGGTATTQNAADLDALVSAATITRGTGFLTPGDLRAGYFGGNRDITSTTLAGALTADDVININLTPASTFSVSEVKFSTQMREGSAGQVWTFGLYDASNTLVASQAVTPGNDNVIASVSLVPSTPISISSASTLKIAVALSTAPQGFNVFFLGNGTGTPAFDVQVIPEPSTYAALAGVLALGLVAYRRRR